MDSTSQSIGSVLKQYLKERGLENRVKEATIPEMWTQLIGENASRHCAVLRFENRQLIVRVDSAVWRSELRLRKQDLITRMNEQLGVTLVDDIILR